MHRVLFINICSLYSIFFIFYRSSSNTKKSSVTRELRRLWHPVTRTFARQILCVCTSSFLTDERGARAESSHTNADIRRVPRHERGVSPVRSTRAHRGVLTGLALAWLLCERVLPWQSYLETTDRLTDDYLTRRPLQGNDSRPGCRWMGAPMIDLRVSDTVT